MLEKKWEYNEAVHQLFIDFKKAYDSVRWDVLQSLGPQETDKANKNVSDQNIQQSPGRQELVWHVSY